MNIRFARHEYIEDIKEIYNTVLLTFLARRLVSDGGVKEEMYYNRPCPKDSHLCIAIPGGKRGIPDSCFGTALVRHAVTATWNMNHENMILACKADNIFFL